MIKEANGQRKEKKNMTKILNYKIPIFLNFY